jgi:ATP-dependent Clp protease adaptor protein ClpS
VLAACRRRLGGERPPVLAYMSPDPREAILTETRRELKLERPRMWRVLLHNDDYTTQDFVVWVLETVFYKAEAEAFTIMMSVHRSGLGVAGIYTRDVAETKLKLTRQLAEEHEYPLLVTMEPEEKTVGGEG